VLSNVVSHTAIRYTSFFVLKLRWIEEVLIGTISSSTQLQVYFLILLSQVIHSKSLHLSVVLHISLHHIDLVSPCCRHQRMVSEMLIASAQRGAQTSRSEFGI